MSHCPHTTCKHGGRVDTHHLWWPRSAYRSSLEKRFREHPKNKVKTCRCMHDLEHLKKPPTKPSAAFMRRFLKES